jgi:hypothetical protein
MPEVRPEVAANAEMGRKDRRNGTGEAIRRRFLARLGLNFEGSQSARAIFNEMLICSACP